MALRRRIRPQQASITRSFPLSNPRNEAGRFRRTEAAKAGNTQAIENALRKGTKINAQDSKGYTPLMYVSLFGRTGTLKELLKKRG